MSSGIVTGVGPYASQVMQDLQQTFNPSTESGITPQLRSLVNTITGQGYSLGVYDFTEGQHLGGPTDPHYTGNAMDVDTLNGASVGNTTTNALEKQFASSVLNADPTAKIGAYGDLYTWLSAQFPGRVFADSAGHIHVQVSPASTSAPAPNPSASPPPPTAGYFLTHPWTLVAPWTAQVQGAPSGPPSWLGDLATNATIAAFFLALLAGGFAILASSAI